MRKRPRCIEMTSRWPSMTALNHQDLSGSAARSRLQVSQSANSPTLCLNDTFPLYPVARLPLLCEVSRSEIAVEDLMSKAWALAYRLPSGSRQGTVGPRPSARHRGDRARTWKPVAHNTRRLPGSASRTEEVDDNTLSLPYEGAAGVSFPGLPSARTGETRCAGACNSKAGRCRSRRSGTISRPLRGR